jgi:hypothetical protein
MPSASVSPRARQRGEASERGARAPPARRRYRPRGGRRSPACPRTGRPPDWLSFRLLGGPRRWGSDRCLWHAAPRRDDRNGASLRCRFPRGGRWPQVGSSPKGYTPGGRSLALTEGARALRQPAAGTRLRPARRCHAAQAGDRARRRPYRGPRADRRDSTSVSRPSCAASQLAAGQSTPFPIERRRSRGSSTSRSSLPGHVAAR